jgi:uncharacterized protein YndB with AHSA1/START domain
MRVGGVWRAVMHGPDGRDYPNHVTFDEIVPPERIVHHHGGSAGEPLHHTTTIRLEDAGGKTLVTLHVLFPTAADRDRIAREHRAEEGGHQTLGRLAAYIPQLARNEAEVEITRLLDAPRELVWRAWTDPVHLARWWGPDGFTNPRCEIDLRPGGAIRIDMQAPDGTVYPMTGEVLESLAPSRLVFTSGPVDHAGKPLLESRTTVTLGEESGKTRLTVKARAKGLVPIARMMLAGMEAGWTQSIERLAELVAKM